jgi:5-methylcytosine-specific restriction endonuclease McrA
MYYYKSGGTWKKDTKKNLQIVSPSTLKRKRDAFERKKLTPAFKRWRAKQYRLQGGKCFYCHHPIDGAWHTDHFIPLGRFYGTSAYKNLRVCCSHCNYYKSVQYPTARVLNELASGVACSAYHTTGLSKTFVLKA